MLSRSAAQLTQTLTGRGVRRGAVSLGVLLVCAGADARTAGLAGASTSFALLALLAAVMAAPGWTSPVPSLGWGLPGLTLLVASAWLAWRCGPRWMALGLARWSRPAGAETGNRAHAGAGPVDGFDPQSVLAAVNPHFVRLQAAWDVADLATLRAMTTPPMFEQIAGQLDQRGLAPNRTDVLTVQAQLLRVEQVGPLVLASVQYSGMLREASEHGAVPFRELWMLAYSPDEADAGWRLAGQQALW